VSAAPDKPQQDPADRALAWQQARRRPDGRFNYPITGFGRDGDYTLWVPNPTADRRYVFKGGKPTVEAAPSCFTDPRINALRDQVIRSITVAGPGLLNADVAFLEYVAGILLVNYDLSDDELTMLLEGSHWHDAATRHLLGGDDMVAMLAEHGADLVARAAPFNPPPNPLPPIDPAPRDAVPPPPATDARPWWKFWR